MSPVRFVIPVRCLLLALFLGLAPGAAPSHAGQSLDQGIRDALNQICPVQFPPPSIGVLGPNLDRYCTFRNSFLIIQGAPAGASGSSTWRSNESAVTREVERRMNGEQEDEQEEAESPDGLRENGGRVSYFVNVLSESFDKEATAIETGFDSRASAALLGVDYRFSNGLLLGAAGGIHASEGDFSQSGGTFEQDSLELVLYASYLPSPKTEIDLMVGHTREDLATNRRSLFEDPDSFSTLFEDEFAPSDTNADELEASMRIGYSIPGGALTLAPYVILDYSRLTFDPFAERGEAALRLAYPSRTEESLTGSLGLFASAPGSYTWGVLVLQASLEWFHEFRKDQRDIIAFFVEDLNPDPAPVVFSTEAPDRDYAQIDLGMSAVLPRGLQPYLNLQVMLEHDYYDNSIVTLGIRKGL